MSKFVSTGFGHYPFGRFPFGHSDFGEDVVVRSFPEEYTEDEGPNGNITTEYMKHYLLTVKDAMNEVKESIDKVHEQIDFNLVRQDLIKHLGTTYGTTVDDSEPLDFQRSLVGNAIPLARIKGTRKAYDIRGKISGFNVNVKKLYNVNDYNRMILNSFNPESVFELPPGSGDFYTDLAPGTVSGTYTDDQCGYCLTSLISIEFTLAKPQPPNTGTESYFDRLIRKLRDIIPIHVRDVLFEFRVVITINEHDNLNAAVALDDKQYFPTPFFYRFDAFPADIVPLDGPGRLTGTISDV